ncbi:MAG: tRNA (adenosine(37)-N6)-threonylcarbamoyltransferase complex transferase subunit TsaD [Candidatus Omnitrophota bacterium]
MLVLGIETSCDETALALVKGGKDIVAETVASSLSLHKKFGGIIPEIANRHHLEYIITELHKTCASIDGKLDKIELIAVTHGPGLVGSLLIGMSCAKALSLCLGVDLIGVNHLKAHLYSGLMQKKDKFPFIGLVVSGGHTLLVKARDYLDFQLLGQTRDDAVGEAYDKVAKILEMGYPGGPVIDKLAKEISLKDCAKFSRPFLSKNSLDFSFSGIKTAVLYYYREMAAKKKITKNDKAKIVAGFQEAVTDVLVYKAVNACRMTGIKKLVIGGGVSANSRLREKMNAEASKNLIEVIFPPMNLCIDNAAMVAGLGYHLYKLGQKSDLTLRAQSNLGF